MVLVFLLLGFVIIILVSVVRSAILPSTICHSLLFNICQLKKHCVIKCTSELIVARSHCRHGRDKTVSSVSAV